MRVFLGIFDDNHLVSSFFRSEYYNNRDMVMRIDKDYRILYYNSSTNKVLRLTPQDFSDYISRHLDDRTLIDDFAEVIITDEYITVQSKVFLQYDYFFRVFNTWNVFYYNGSPVFDFTLTEDNKLIMYIHNDNFDRHDFNCNLIVDLHSKSFSFDKDITRLPFDFKDLKDLVVSDIEILDTIYYSDEELQNYIKDYIGSYKYTKLMLLGR